MNEFWTILQRSNAPSTEDFINLFADIPKKVRSSFYQKYLPDASYWIKFCQLYEADQSELWILYDQTEKRALGRVSANLSLTQRDRGYLGCFEAVNAASAKILLSNAIQWLRSKGIQKAYGPVNGNTWFSYRFRVNFRLEDSDRFFPFEPLQPPEYVQWFSDSGFDREISYHTDGLDGIEGILTGTQKEYERASGLGYVFRPFDAQRILEREVPVLYEISMHSFQENFLFEPISFENFKELYVPLSKAVDCSFSHYVCRPDGKEVGFHFCILLGNCLVLKTIAVLPEARGLGLSNALMHSVLLKAKQRGIKTCIAALMKEGIQSETYSRKQRIVWQNKFSLFEKVLQ